MNEETTMKTWTMSHHFLINHKAKMYQNNNHFYSHGESVVSNVLLNLLNITQKCKRGVQVGWSLETTLTWFYLNLRDPLWRIFSVMWHGWKQSKLILK